MVLIQVCDVCMTPGKSLTTYSVRRENLDPVELALCVEDDLIAGLLDSVGQPAQPTPRALVAKRAPARKTTARRSTRVATVAEIEASKRG